MNDVKLGEKHFIRQTLCLLKGIRTIAPEENRPPQLWLGVGLALGLVLLLGGGEQCSSGEIVLEPFLKCSFSFS